MEKMHNISELDKEILITRLKRKHENFFSKLYFNEDISYQLSIPFTDENLDYMRYLQNDKFYCLYDSEYTKEEDGEQIGGIIKTDFLKNTEQDNLNLIKQMVKISKTSSKPVSDACIEVSIDKNILEDNKTYLIRFLKLYSAYENIIYKFGYKVGKKYKLKDVEFSRKMIYENMDAYEKAKDFDDVIFNIYLNSHLHAFGLDLESISKDRGVITFRNAHATLNPFEIQNLVSFYVNMLLAAKNDNLNWDYIDKLFKERNTKESEAEYFEFDIDSAIDLSNMLYTDKQEEDQFLKKYIS